MHSVASTMPRCVLRLGIQTTDTPVPDRANEEYGLRVDDQVVQFLQLKQRLSYFLITAAVTVIAFVVSFIATNAKEAGVISITHIDTWLVISGSIAGVAAAGATLLSLHFGHRSFALHLGYRYVHQGYDDLSLVQQKAWDGVNRRSVRLSFAAFVLLFVEIVLMVAFFSNFFLVRTS
jgi:hypothetical protein